MKTYNEIDRLSSDSVRKIQGELLSGLVRRVAAKSSFYRKLFEQHGLSPEEIRSIDDLEKIPFTNREDIGRNNWEFLSVDSRDIAELVSTTGTTGNPVYIAMTRNDLRRLAYNEEKSFLRIGAVRGDLFFIDVTCDNLFIAGIAYYSGLLNIGAGVVRVGPQNMARQLDLLRMLKPVGIVAVPSYIVQLARRAENEGCDVRDFGIEKIVLIGDSVRNEDLTLNSLGDIISSCFGDTFYSTYGITEGQVSFCECRVREGLHSNPDLIIAEIVNEQGSPMRDGETGELVITTIQTEGMPLLRYRTGDITYKISKPCGCGRTSARIGPIIGRKHQRLKFKGVTLYPKSIENAILAIDDVVNYQIEAYSGDDHTDRVLIRIGSDRNDGMFTSMLAETIKAKLRVSPEVEIMSPESLRRRLYFGGSRKAVTFLDTRSKSGNS